MEGNRRVYPCWQGNRWISVLLLCAAALLLVGGLAERQDRLSIVPFTTQTPVPLNEPFDETMVTEELALPMQEWHALQLGVFEEENGAREMADLFVKRGAAGYVWYDGRYRALAAVYPSKEDAQRVRGRLADNASLETYLYSIQLPPLRLRISGMKGQLDILQAAFLHAGDLIDSLYQISTELDQHTLNGAKAVTDLKALAEQMGLVILRLEQRFVPPRPAAVDALLECFGNFTLFSADIDENIGLVELGMRVKYQNLHSLFLLQTVYDTLNHT